MTSWVVLGTGRTGYSPVHDPISRLAAVGASSRAPMTLGLVALAGGLAAYARASRTSLPGAVAPVAALSAVATLGVAAFPLGSALGDRPHAAAAAAAYASLAALPILGRRVLDGEGSTLSVRLSVAAGLGTGAALAASIAAPSGTGLWQRVGLTLGHAWIAASAVRMLRPSSSGALAISA